MMNSTENEPAINKMTVFNDTMDETILMNLSKYQNEYMERDENSGCCAKTFYFTSLLLLYILPYIRFLSIVLLNIILFVNIMKSSDDFFHAIDLAIVNALLSALLYYIIQVISSYSKKIQIHENYYSYIIICKDNRFSHFLFIEYTFHLCVIIAVLVSLETYSDSCIKNYDDCVALWKLWRKIF